MDLSLNSRKIYEFADFRLIPDEDILLRGGQPVALTPKAFTVLAILVERNGHMVSKSELLDLVWNDSFVEEGALSKAVWYIRQALGDTSKEKFIQTVPRRGYRFVFPVSVVTNGSGAFRLSDLARIDQEVTHVEGPLINGNGKEISGGLETPVMVGESSQQVLTEVLNDGLTVASLPNGEDSAPRRGIWLGWGAWLTVGVFLASTIILGTLYFRRTAPFPQTVRFPIPPPEKTEFSGLALSPNGRRIAFAATDSAGSTSLWVRSVDTVDSRQLPGTEGASFPFWSPDSQTIAFFAGNKLRKIDIAGGPSQTLADVTNDPRGGAWANDGTIIYSPSTTSPLMRVPASGGTATEITKLDNELGQTSHRWPSMLPDGKHFIYFGRGTDLNKQGIFVSSIGSPGVAKLLMASTVSGTYAEVDGTSYLLFADGFALFARRFDASSLDLSGDAIPVVQGVYTVPGEVGPTGYSAFSAASGNLLYFTGEKPTSQFNWFDRSGKLLGSLTEPGQDHEPSLSKDDTKLLFGRSTDAPHDIYVLDLSRGSTTRLTSDPAGDSSALFSPDETQVVFYSSRHTAGLYRKPVSGAGEDELLLADSNRIYPDSWSHDGRYLLFDKIAGPDTKVDLWVLPMGAAAPPFPYLATEYKENHAQFSPDGRWVAYASNESGRDEVYIQSFPIGNGKWQVSTAGGDQPQWRADGGELFYIAADRNLMATRINGSTFLEIGRPEGLFKTNVPLTSITDERNSYVPTRDGQRFLVNTLNETTNAQPLTFVLNWAVGLNK